MCLSLDNKAPVRVHITRERDILSRQVRKVRCSGVVCVAGKGGGLGMLTRGYKNRLLGGEISRLR